MSEPKVVKMVPPSEWAPNNPAVADSLRRLARDIENGDYGGVNVVVSVIECDQGHLAKYVCGKAIDTARTCGLLCYAQAMTISGEMK